MKKLFLTLTPTLAILACVPAPPAPPADTTAPTVTEKIAVTNPARTFTPAYTFNTTEAGTIIYGGDCNSATLSASSGDNTIIFSTLGNGTYSNCSIQVKDSAGNTSSPLSVASFTIEWMTRPLNDTGQTYCGDYTTITSDNDNNLNCSTQTVVPTQEDDGTETPANGGNPIPAGQDALYGRDVTHNDDSNGHAGFDFTRLAADGSDTLIDCSGHEGDDSKLSLAESQSCYQATPWACVRDNVTGLIWEVKTTNGLQNQAHTYTWYNADTSNNGGTTGTSNGGTCSDGSGCDTSIYVSDLNALSLCGEDDSNDWRVPTKNELFSIVAHDRTSPTIDYRYFPNTVSGEHWVSTAHSSSSAYAWLVNFSSGSGMVLKKFTPRSVRLVRNSN